MRTLIALLAVLLTAACSAKTKPDVEILRPSYLDAVRPLQMNDLDLAILMEELGTDHDGYKTQDGPFQNICSVGSINRWDHNWITAAHCVSHGKTVYIEEQPAKILEMDEANDLAVLQVPGLTAGAELKLGSQPNWKDSMMIVGHPLGMEGLFVTAGTIADPSWANFMWFSAPAAPGNSGSPVLNTKGEIVSVLQVAFVAGPSTFGAVSGGATYQNLRWFARYFTPNVTDRILVQP